jgi:DNA mismatch repair protein MutL
VTRIIHILPERVASQIAAGEVVERPASTLKELVENALDAGARTVSVELERGGGALIAVGDDGCGMGREDATLALRRHATSKIRDAADLTVIRTLGFRGEALAAIASVARMTLRTRRPADDHGVAIAATGGEIERVEACAMAPGTRIEVRELFFNTPARLKFLKTVATEQGAAAVALQRIAIANYRVAFTLTGDGRSLIALPRAAAPLERLRQLCGAKLAERMLGFDYRTGAGRAWGLAATSQESFATPRMVFTFVNGRAVRDRLLARAITQAYQTLLPRGRHPAVVLFVELRAEEVDVNVHPMKTEVRFRHAGALFELVYHALRARLSDQTVAGSGGDRQTAAGGTNQTAAGGTNQSAASGDDQSAGAVGEDQQTAACGGRNDDPDTIGGNPRAADHRSSGLRERPLRLVADVPIISNVQRALGLGYGGGGRAAAAGSGNGGRAGSGESLSDGSASGNDGADRGGAVHRIINGAGMAQPAAPRASDGAAEIGIEQPTGQWTGTASRGAPVPRYAELKVLGQLFAGYIVLEDGDGLLLVDQHAAHERVTFERLSAQLRAGGVRSQALLAPATLELPPARAAQVAAGLAELGAIGFELEPFGPSTLLLKGVPAVFGAEGGLRLLTDLLDGIGEGGLGGRGAGAFEDLLKRLACHGSVRVGRVLAPGEIAALLAALDATPFKSNCPHGRPVHIRFGRNQIERLFRR